MKTLLGYVLTPILLLAWGLLLNIFHVLQFVAFNAFGENARRAMVDLFNFSMLHTLWILGTRIRVDYAEILPTNRPIIFVSNHQNKFDIPGISWYLRKHVHAFVSKIELSKGIPGISYNLRHSGAALIDRNDARQAFKEIARLGKLIEARKSAAVIFPEGTRSRTGEPTPFAAGGIKILLRNAPSALVVPICINGAWKLNRFGAFPMSVGEEVTWSVLSAIDPAGKSPDQVASLAEQAIRAKLARQ